MEEPALTFAALLRQLRAEARLTQEELAAAAGLSPRSVSDLERGINRTARKDSAALLAGALGLPGPVAELFVAAARGRGPAGDVVAARQGTALAAFAAAAESPRRALAPHLRHRPGPRPAHPGVITHTQLIAATESGGQASR